MPKPKVDMDQLRQAARQPGASRHSPLFRWMADRRAEFAAMVSETPRPNWPALATVLARMGLHDANGVVPSGKVARQTWWKVCRDPRTTPPVLPTEGPAPVVVTKPAPPRPLPPAAAPAAHGLRFAGGLRNANNPGDKTNG